MHTLTSHTLFQNDTCSAPKYDYLLWAKPKELPKILNLLNLSIYLELS